MKNYPKLLNAVVTASLSLAIASSFFIFKDIHLGVLKLPQPFYLFLFISLVAISLKIKTEIEYRKIFTEILKKYWLITTTLFSFIALNLLCYLFINKTEGRPPFFYVDLLRVIIEVVLASIITLHLTINKTASSWLMLTFFIPLVLTPLFFFRDIDKIINILPNEFFSNYSLQALQYNTTSLATWLIITFAFSTSFLFKKIQDKKIPLICLFSFSTIITTSLIWWTNSRGALLASILIFVTISVLYYWKKKINLVLALIAMLLIFFMSLNILPPQAKNSIFVRYYPQYRQEIVENNFKTDSIRRFITKSSQNTDPDIEPKVTDARVIKEEIKIILQNPSFIADQDRQNIWPKHIIYILNKPLGTYGPELLYNSKLNNLLEGEHNSILQAGKWGGLGALIITLLIFFYTGKLSLNLIKKHKGSPYIIGLTMAFLGIFILMMLNSFLHLKTFWILMAMIIACSWQKKNELDQKTPKTRDKF